MTGSAYQQGKALFMKKSLAVLLATGLAATTAIASANAETLRWARAGDSLTLDPHAQNEGPTHTLAHQMYEPLLQRDMAGQIIPALATEWAALADNPNIWEFKLRAGVTFHGGEAFTAEDVVYSLKRAMMPTSAMKELLSSVEDVKAVDDLTVHIITSGPNPLMPNNLTNLFIMDADWAAAQCPEPQDIANGGDNPCVRAVNGTGAYKLASRAQDQETVLEMNADYWGKDQFPMEVTKIIYTPIQESATRVSALLSGEVDFIQDVPVQDLGRVAQTDGLQVVTASQNRTIFFGMDVGSTDLDTDNIDGKNPLADVRVRQAMNIAINREAIKKVVMRDQSAPTGVIMPPFVNGWTTDLDAYPAYDIAAAKALMAEAGYADGFSIPLNCPNDRYINDEAICQAAVGMFGQIGIDVTLDAKPKAQHFPLIKNKETDFYMLGWGVPTFDSEYIFNFLVHSTTDSLGSWNGTGYSNSDVDAMIVSLASETDLAARNETIAKIWSEVQAQTLYLPIHNQVLNWGMTSKIAFPVQPEDQPHFKFLQFN